jgi:hypothetical protein
LLATLIASCHLAHAPCFHQRASHSGSCRPQEVVLVILGVGFDSTASRGLPGVQHLLVISAWGPGLHHHLLLLGLCGSASQHRDVYVQLPVVPFNAALTLCCSLLLPTWSCHEQLLCTGPDGAQCMLVVTTCCSRCWWLRHIWCNTWFGSKGATTGVWHDSFVRTFHTWVCAVDSTGECLGDANWHVWPYNAQEANQQVMCDAATSYTCSSRRYEPRVFDLDNSCGWLLLQSQAFHMVVLPRAASLHVHISTQGAWLTTTHTFSEISVRCSGHGARVHQLVGVARRAIYTLAAHSGVGLLGFFSRGHELQGGGTGAVLAGQSVCLMKGQLEQID